MSLIHVLYRFKTFKTSINISLRGRRGRDRIVVGFTTTIQPVHITTDIVSSNPAHARCT